jgi:hypothetical protein
VDSEHWFDALNKALVRDAPRRTMLRAAAVATSLALGVPLEARPKKGKKRKVGKKKRKKDRPNSPPPSCSGGACAAEPEYASNQEQIDFCELICRQCDGNDPRQFCITEGVKPDGSPTMVARCCETDQECCGSQCCGPAGKCCDLGGRGKICISPNAECCPDDTERGYCSPEQECCPGYGCVDPSESCVGCVPCSPGKFCQDGVCVCQEGLTLCGDICRDTARDENNCGRCGQRCTDPNRPDCCDGQCVNTRYHPHHCGRCHHRCERHEFCASTGDCLCSTPCCHGNDSGVCVGPWFCCTEPCSRCAVGECLRWRDGIENGYCEERANACQVIPELTYCPISDITYDCCGPNETCGATACVPA